mmetsp:Transcript_7549/g.17288  ORF Transcript_7549/g.17288 Transcript_7549/m.17288 type:complete len:123 (-) Transcript_7549:490-858(-)
MGWGGIKPKKASSRFQNGMTITTPTFLHCTLFGFIVPYSYFITNHNMFDGVREWADLFCTLVTPKQQHPWYRVRYRYPKTAPSHCKDKTHNRGPTPHIQRNHGDSLLWEPDDNFPSSPGMHI